MLHNIYRTQTIPQYNMFYHFFLCNSPKSYNNDNKHVQIILNIFSNCFAMIE